MSIRRSGADDLEALERADRICFPLDTPYPFGADLGPTWVVRDGDESGAYLAAHELKRRTLFFARVGVLPQHRGQGLQRKLMAVMERWARAEGWQEIVTYTLPFNYHSTTNIFGAGYRTYEPKVSQVGFEVVHMRKRLA